MTEENINSSSYFTRKFKQPGIQFQGQTDYLLLQGAKRYQIRRVKNKGAVLILVIRYLVTTMLYFLATIALHYLTHQICLILFSYHYHSHSRMFDRCLYQKVQSDTLIQKCLDHVAVYGCINIKCYCWTNI